MHPADPPLALQNDSSLTAALNILGPASYTAERLQHADAEHLHLTSRRCFIGPIPEGWLKSHRKQWYKHYLGIHHSSRAPSFSAPSNVGSHRRMTGIEHSHVKQSFPQPSDAVDGTAGSTAIGAYGQESEAVGTNNTEEEAVDERSPAVSFPRAGHEPAVLREDPVGDTDQPVSSLDAEASSQLHPDSAKEDRKKAIHTKHPRKPRIQRQISATSYETAHEQLGEINPEPIEEPEAQTPGSKDILTNMDDTAAAVDDHGASTTSTTTPRDSTALPGSLNIPPGSPALSGQVGSTASLLRADEADAASPTAAARSQNEPSRPSRHARFATEHDANKTNGADLNYQHRFRADNKVQFDLPDISSRRAELQVRARLAQAGLKRQGRVLTRGRLADGQVVKWEKMLLRIDLAVGSEQPEADFSEKDSQRIETRVVEKWREFMVVCRECDHDNAALTLQLYQSRVIPASNKSHVKKRFKYEILLDRANVRVNLYSSLDKTIAICTKEGSRTKIHFLRTRSGTSAVEWFHFLRQVLGLRRAKTIQVNIPDLNASIRLDNPFDRLMNAEELGKAADGDETALVKAAQSESAVAQSIIDRCLDMLSRGDEWRDILNARANHDHIGLAWRRYDRLEWVHGEHERKMYGANAMLRSHELELRSKQHYPQTTKTRSGKILAEPPPVEGFLIRLTSQKGTQQKLGKFFFKRLYYASHNQFLLFLRPGRARPPPPPKMPMTQNSHIPSTGELSGKIPLIYAVNPFPLQDGQVSWLAHNDHVSAIAHDSDAKDELDRNVDMLHNCDGFLNLCDVVKVRSFTQGADTTDDQAEDGSDVDFDQGVGDSLGPDGTTTQVDHDRTFELVLKNGLVVRLQTFNKATKEEWILRLRDLVRYWRHRSAADMELFRLVRSENLQALNIDERTEADVGQFSQKWEVIKSFASPELYHMCGISSCRAVHNAGVLYRKPRIHSTFKRCYVILCSGHLIIFQDTLRTQTGKKVAHIHHERIASIDLKDCYLYSGLITDDDLLYQNRTFDSNAPGSHALPRMFLEDSWTSTDEDAMTTFVIWHGQRKGWFRSQEIDDVKNKNRAEKPGTRQKLKRVNQLGVKGRSVVFKARSRAERDHWVMGISAEIEKVAKGESAKGDEARIVGGEQDE
ncbi:hypothetical protein K461DRAFT_320516 [Myriangium duriaei CBS 260.36]|uniref:PH domain-containing protein n=1 Tax=Myriangium duriaei CBS 260.36 TaxID=1168546 RepID=A0A9P4J8I2_9PEZI|nr:hypothetical protein K461DRAFT_320516 [Myriangium duriaei CBS 260.36]